MAKRDISAENPPNAVIYARYSSGSQNEQSIEGQLRTCREFAERQGLPAIDVYIDRAISGRSDERPEFQRMIADAERRQFRYIVVYRLDRFSRNRYDSAIYKTKLKKCGVRVLSATEGISDTPEGRILEALMEAHAEYYSEELSRKIIRGFRESAIKGNYINSIPPLGYLIKDKKLVIDPGTAPLVQEVFRRYADGEKKSEIVKSLTARGIRNAHGEPYGKTAFQEVLKNEKYLGVSQWRDVRIEEAFPALIDRETWDRVQARVAAAARQGRHLQAKEEYLLFGKAFCGYCGERMAGESGRGRGGAVYRYYTCGGRKRGGACKKKLEKKDWLEKYVVETTLKHVLTDERMAFIADKVAEEYRRDTGAEKIRETERQIYRLNLGIDKLCRLIEEAESRSVRKRHEERVIALEAEKEDAEASLARLKIAAGTVIGQEDTLLWLKTFCDGDPEDPEFRRKIIEAFIYAVYIYDDKAVIYYNVRGGGREVAPNRDPGENVGDGEARVENEVRMGAGISRKVELIRTPPAPDGLSLARRRRSCLSFPSR